MGQSTPLALLHRAHQRADGLFASAIGGVMTHRQFMVMSAVASSDGCSQTDIVAHTGIDRSTMADLVRRLIGKGWIKRRRTPEDTRAYAVRITDQGTAALKVAAEAAEKAEDEFLAGLSKSDCARFAALLEVLAGPVEGVPRR